jgi:hypothetical protein
MELKINRVVGNDVPEHKDLNIVEYVYVQDITKISQSIKSKDLCDVMFTWGETITVGMGVTEFKNYVDNFIKKQDEEKREEERRRDLGY